jgi:NADH-quinone oxidoreductase subunit M
VGGIGLPDAWQFPALVIALVTILVAGSAALLDNDAKRILAYSTIAQLGYILLGLATLTSIGVAGALVFLLAHSLAKACSFASGSSIYTRHARPRELGDDTPDAGDPSLLSVGRHHRFLLPWAFRN